jgi:hypothetical protein
LPPPNVPTLGQLRAETPWLWVYCGARYCNHSAPLALVPVIIRWGADASSDVLRHRARCCACGHLGATLRHPSWGDSIIGWKPFSIDRVEPAAQTVETIP